jgi:hypothetical protein
MYFVWDRVDDYAFYSAKETVLDVLKFAVALEIWRKSFSSFPRARVRVGVVLAVVLLATATLSTLVTSLLGLLSHQPGAYQVLGMIDAGGYFVTSVWWAWAAWRTSSEPSPLLARLQPWAHSW